MTPTEMMLKLQMDNWNTQLKRTTALINELTDEQLARETSPKRNTGIYLAGHLIAVHDAMLPLLGLGNSLHPELLDPFVKQPDSKTNYPATIAQLRDYWKEVHAAIAEKFAALTPEEWLQRHTSVSEEDFAKEPHRNRMNVLMSRTLHLAGHHGQMIYLKGKDE